MKYIKCKGIIGTLSLISLIFCAGLLNTFGMGEQTSEHFKVLEKSENSLNLLTYIQKGMQDTTLPERCKQVLSSPTIDLDTKEYIATEVAKIVKTDKPILYLLAVEIGRILNGIVLPLDQGYLIFSGNDWAIFLEHGKSMQTSRDSTGIISALADTFSWVLLASCNSIYYSQRYTNVQGYDREITIDSILNLLGKKYMCNEILQSKFKDCTLRNYKLDVTPAIFPVTSIFAIPAIIGMALMNLQLNVPYSFIGFLPLEPGQQVAGGPNFGVAHINFKCSPDGGNYGDDINNLLITEVLTSLSSVAIIFPGGDGTWICLVIKFKPKNSGDHKVASVLIGVNPLLPLSTTYYTIKSASVAGKDEEDEEEAVDAILFPYFDPDMNQDPDKERKKYGFTPSLALSKAPYTLNQLDSIYDYNVDPSTDNEIGKIVTQMLLWLSIGWPMWLIFTKCNDRLKNWLGDGTVKYYAVWIAIAIAYLIAIAATVALVILFWEALPVIVPTIAELLRRFITASAGAGAAACGEGNEPIGNLLPKSVSFESPEMDEADIDLETSFYDDDNDGIPNTIEYSYFLKYINGTIEQDLYIGQEYTWLDPLVDYDGDGLATMTEYIYDSDPFMLDTDNDELDDNEEILVDGTPRTISATLTDSDRDGILDTQSIYIQGNIDLISNPSKYDTDYDGMSDKMEFDEDLKPFNRDQDNDRMIDGWEVYTCNLGWNEFGDGFGEDDKYNPTSTPTNPTNWEECDPDGDYVPNYIESLYFTNPYSFDTDGDGLSDRWEIEEDFDPTDPNDGLFDNDQDGLSTGDEVSLYGTYWGLPDSDGDGLLDGNEVLIYNTDPQFADTDEDNIDDWEEVYIGTDGFVTNPNNADTDGDQLGDYYEIMNGLNPTNTDSDSDGLLDNDEMYVYFTDPGIADSDTDGWTDGFEIETSLTDPTLLDSDNDGINDVDEYNLWISLGVDTSTAYDYCSDSDADNDGLSDGHELSLNCDPLNPDSDYDGLCDGTEVHGYLTNPLIVDTEGDGMADGFEIDYGLNPLVDDSAGDPDNDDLSNVDEFSNLTDPTDPDTDGDGMDDGWEVTYSLNPKIDDALTHSDSDNLYNIDEFTYGTDPFDPDCDNDGLNDKQEIFIYNTNPWDTDSDNDGLTDGDEVNSLGTDPDNEDTDEDGLLDGEETILGDDGFITDPLDPDTDDDSLLDGEEYTHSTNPVNSDTDSDSFDDYQEIFTYSTDPLNYNSNPARISPNICRNFYGLPNGISKVYFTWNAPTNYWAGNAEWSAWTYVLKIKIGTTWTTIYSGTSRSKNYTPPSATTSYSYRLYCYNQHTGVYSIYLSWYGAAKSSGGGGGPM